MDKVDSKLIDQSGKDNEVIVYRVMMYANPFLIL